MKRLFIALPVLIFLLSSQAQAQMGMYANAGVYAGGGAYMGQQNCSGGVTIPRSVVKIEAEQKRLEKSRKKLEKRIRDLERTVEKKEKDYKQYESSITTWFENKSDTNIAAAVIKELDGENLRITPEQACTNGVVNPDTKVPWVSFCQAPDDQTTFSAAAKRWFDGTQNHRTNGELAPEICGKEEFVKSS
ncbi:MAG: hypothetical protein KDD38_05920, partial [Bdellovibrionales bacterium]|nr:hypothetical protein [Bdellovibrionales bacterium]